MGLDLARMRTGTWVMRITLVCTQDFLFRPGVVQGYSIFQCADGNRPPIVWLRYCGGFAVSTQRVVLKVVTAGMFHYIYAIHCLNLS